jgi:hypothetical protein
VLPHPFNRLVACVGGCIEELTTGADRERESAHEFHLVSTLWELAPPIAGTRPSLRLKGIYRLGHALPVDPLSLHG